MSSPPDNRQIVGPIPATWLGFSLVAMTLLGVVASRRIAVQTLFQAWLVIVITAGQTFLLGAVALALVALFRRFVSEKRGLSVLALVVCSGGLGVFVLDTDVSGVADRLSASLKLPHAPLLVLLSILFSMVVPVAFLMGRLFSRRWLRLFALLVGLAIAVVSVEVQRGLYEGLHLFSILSSATFIAAALAYAEIPARVQSLPRFVGFALMGVTTLWGFLSVALVPSDTVRLALLGLPAAILSPYPLFAPDDGGEDWAPANDEAQWFESRADRPSIPATTPRILPPNPAVLFITIDSFRADVLEDPKRALNLPFMFQLRDSSAYFAQARAAGAATSPSLSSLFACGYYSQIYWTRRADWGGTFFPYEDPRPRFPELLTLGGVHTATADSTGWLINDFHIVRGFQDEKTVRTSGQYPRARDVFAPIPGFLREHLLQENQGAPLFIYAHLLDAHSPYNSAKTTGPAFERYVAELGLVDLELRRLRVELVRMGLWDKLTLIITADHGEGFGEHGLTLHGNSLYDELLHVPLLIRVPGQAARRIDTRVSLIDLGPTILDLFGVPTPGMYMGQSLVPLIAGKPATLTRPIVAEGQLKHAIITPDGMKIIHDSRLHTVELYDLNADPGEKQNLYNKESKEAVAKLGMVKRFFDVVTFRRPGYKVPYRRW